MFNVIERLPVGLIDCWLEALNDAADERTTVPDCRLSDAGTPGKASLADTAAWMEGSVGACVAVLAECALRSS